MKSIIHTLIFVFQISICFSQIDSLRTDIQIDSNIKSENKYLNKKNEVESKTLKKLIEIEKLIKENKKQESIWKTLIPLLIGSSLTLLTQFLIEFRKTYKENRNKKIEIKAELIRLTFLLKDHYRELAMHKAHKHYWYAQYRFEKTTNKPNPDEVNKFYDYHIISANKVRETEIKIADSFSEYCKKVNKLQALTHFNNEIQEYQNYKPSKPKDIWSNVQQELYKIEADEEERLRKEYERYIEIVKNINKKLT